MMALEPKDAFTFIWKIENFSMCPQKKGDYLMSPIFMVDQLEKSEWRIWLYPRGNDEGTMSCFLYRIYADETDANISIGFMVTIHSENINKKITREVKNHTFQKSCSNWGFYEICPPGAIFENKDAFLPNDTLTLKCCMWKTEKECALTEHASPDCLRSLQAEFDHTLAGEMFISTARDELLDLEKQFSAVQCSVRTIIKVRRKHVLWPIRRFSALHPNQKLSIPVQFAVPNTPTFILSFYLSENSNLDQSACLEIRMKGAPPNGSLFVRCKVSTAGAPKNSQYETEDDHFFEVSNFADVWEFPNFIKVQELLNKDYLSYTHDILYLNFSFSYSCRDEDYDSDITDVGSLSCHMQESSGIKRPRLNFRHLYKDGKFTDIVLRVGDRTFAAHKSIIGDKSPVFNAMFENDMQEKETGIVDIIDFEPDTVNNLLDFMYSDCLENLNPTEVAKLYVASDKYEVLPLKWQCGFILQSTLTTSNVCEMLMLADSHHDVDLLEAVQKFISANTKEIILSVEWKNFMKTNSVLSANILHQMLVQMLN